MSAAAWKTRPAILEPPRRCRPALWLTNLQYAPLPRRFAPSLARHLVSLHPAYDLAHDRLPRRRRRFSHAICSVPTWRAPIPEQPFLRLSFRLASTFAYPGHPGRLHRGSSLPANAAMNTMNRSRSRHTPDRNSRRGGNTSCSRNRPKESWQDQRLCGTWDEPSSQKAATRRTLSNATSHTT